MPITLYGNPVLDPNDVYTHCRQSRPQLPVDWFGLPNYYRCPLGAKPGVGAVLMRLSDIDTTTGAAGGPLVFNDGAGGSVTIQKVYITSTRCVTPGYSSDPNAAYLVEIADQRCLQLRPTTNFDIKYNTCGFGSGPYPSGDLDGSSPWSWSRAVQDLWAKVIYGLAGIGSASGGQIVSVDSGIIPSFGYPVWFEYDSANWPDLRDALDHLLIRLGCAVKYDPTGPGFSIVCFTGRPASHADRDASVAAIAAMSSALSFSDYPASTTIPPSEVYAVFDQNSGQAWSGSGTPNVVFTESTGLFSDGLAYSSIGNPSISVRDDLLANLTALSAFTGTAPGSTTLATRANERIKDFWQIAAVYGKPQVRVYNGILSGAVTALGALWDEIAFEDRGSGYKTAISRSRRPLDAVSRWAPARPCTTGTSPPPPPPPPSTYSIYPAQATTGGAQRVVWGTSGTIYAHAAEVSATYTESPYSVHNDITQVAPTAYSGTDVAITNPGTLGNVYDFSGAGGSRYFIAHDFATALLPGLVSTQPQTFAGAKTFNNGITVNQGETINFDHSHPATFTDENGVNLIQLTSGQWTGGTFPSSGHFVSGTPGIVVFSSSYGTGDTLTIGGSATSIFGSAMSMGINSTLPMIQLNAGSGATLSITAKLYSSGYETTHGFTPNTASTFNVLDTYFGHSSGVIACSTTIYSTNWASGCAAFNDSIFQYWRPTSSTFQYNNDAVAQSFCQLTVQAVIATRFSIGVPAYNYVDPSSSSQSWNTNVIYATGADYNISHATDGTAWYSYAATPGGPSNFYTQFALDSSKPMFVGGLYIGGNFSTYNGPTVSTGGTPPGSPSPGDTWYN